VLYPGMNIYLFPCESTTGGVKGFHVLPVIKSVDEITVKELRTVVVRDSALQLFMA
jgi:hypothetical protein